MFYATLDHTEQLAPAIRRFWFRPESALDFVAGQFIELHIPHEAADDRGQKRWFTISSPPTDELFSITSKFSNTQPSSFKQALLHTPLGTRLHFADPMGDFVLPKDKRIPLIFVAGGIGITPVHSMIKYLSDTGQQRDIQLIYDVHQADELLFTDLFKTYDLQFTPLVTTASTDWSGDVGRIEAAHLLQLAKAQPTSLVYMSGPEQLVEKLTTELQLNGVPGRRLITDYFHGYKSV